MRATMTVTTTKVATTTVTTTTTVTFFLLMWQGLLPIYFLYTAPISSDDPTNQNPRMFDLAWTCRTSEGVIKRLRAPKWAPGASMTNRHGFGEPP